MELYPRLLKQIQTHYPKQTKKDLSLIHSAYEFADEMHREQKRATGEPYIIHPVEVAEVLIQMKMDFPSIVAALLHDTVEDTGVSLEDIKKKFNPEIALLVDGVTKLGKIRFSNATQKQAENLRKMFFAMAKDVRVVLIKLADRLNNMRTLHALSEEKRNKIALETLEIYAPLANRLGIQWMKVDLEDLSFRYLTPELYYEILDKMKGIQKESQNYIDQVVHLVSQKLNQYKVGHDIYGRFKHAYSVYRKMKNQNISFEQINDLIAFRILVDDLRDCYAVLGVIHEIWTPIPGRFKDYIAMPKANQYQSLHTTVICLKGQRAEFQIRTREMNEIAEKGIAAHWTYKEGGKFDEKDRQKIQWIQDLLRWQKELKDSVEFLDTVKFDLFATDVYIFTPKGEVKELPYHATPVDFAYSIHTDVGNHCVGAKVNERIVPLDYRLQNGDTVEVLTNPHHKPSKDWLKFAVTSRARTKIRQVIQLEQKEKSILLGRELLEKEFSSFGVSSSKYLKGDQFSQLVKQLGVKTLEGLEANVGYGKIASSAVVALLVPKEIQEKRLLELKKPQTVLGRLIKKAKERFKSVVKVNGYDDILVSAGKCCTPLPGDPITGYITRGRGVIIHFADCGKLLSTEPERRVEVVLDAREEVIYHTKLRVVSVDRPGLLASMSKVIANEGVNISQAQIRTSNDQKAINTFEVEVSSVPKVRAVVRALERLKGVISVERIRG